MHYFTQHSQQQQQQRYEDVIVANPARELDTCYESRPFSAWAVLDGHSGDEVARYLAANLVPELERRLPAVCILHEATQQEQYAYAEQVRRAVLGTFLRLSLDVQQQFPGSRCGSTATVAVHTGQLLTVANVGNTKCVLDVGTTVFECTADHRLGNNEDEEVRLDAAGACIARLKFDLSGPAAPGESGIGSLRMWPGGLHMSRAIGDSDCGHLVLPHPHIHQVWLPHRACRMIIATGSVWEGFETYHKAASALRGVSLHNAAGALLQRALKHKQHVVDKGDFSVLVVDFVPECLIGFSSQTRLDKLSRSSTCSHSNHQSTSLPAAAASLFHRSSAAARLAASLSLNGMRSPTQRMHASQQQQHYLCRQSTSSSNASSTAGSPTSSAPTTPALTPSSSGRGMTCNVPSEQYADLLQQQLQQHNAGLLQRLLPRLCLRPSAVYDAASIDSQQSNASVLQSARSIDSAVSDSMSTPRMSSSSANSPCSKSAGSGGSWRSFKIWQKRSTKAQQVGTAKHDQSDCSHARIIARLDTFKMYFRGQHQPLQLQADMVDRTVNWTTVRPLRSCSDTAATADCI